MTTARLQIDIRSARRRFGSEFLRLSARCSPEQMDQNELLLLIHQVDDFLRPLIQDGLKTMPVVEEFRISARNAATFFLMNAPWIDDDLKEKLRDFRDS